MVTNTTAGLPAARLFVALEMIRDGLALGLFLAGVGTLCILMGA